MSKIYSEPVKPTPGLDLLDIFGKDPRQPSETRLFVREVVKKMTRIGDIQRIRFEDETFMDIEYKERMRRWSSLRSMVVDEAKRAKWPTDEDGHVIRTRVIKDNGGQEWLWVVRLGPNLSYSNFYKAYSNFAPVQER